LAAFPIKPASEAVEALLEAWAELSAPPRKPWFNEKSREDDLTKTLKIIVATDVARRKGLLGSWTSEDVFGRVDVKTGKRLEERRTDIVYIWNDTSQSMHLVFEFKRMGRKKADRDHYLGDRGLGRFVTGIYSHRQAVAAMVGVLLDPEHEVVPPIVRAFDDHTLCTGLRVRRTRTGEALEAPSALFPSALFDTEHERDPSVAPSHGSIRVSHFFLSFGYPTSTRKQASA
jgi:hypothetical protein